MKRISCLTIIIILFCTFLINNVNGEMVDIEEQNGIWFFLEGVEGDIITISLFDSSQPVDIWILTQGDYKNYWTDQNFNVEWKVEEVTNGEWTWRMKSNEQWVFLINNPNNESVSVEYSVTGGDESVSYDDLYFILFICGIVAIVVPIIVIGVILTITYFINKKDEKKIEPKFVLVEDS